MKVYVDELPKSCSYCPCKCFETDTCQLNKGIKCPSDNKIANNCPLKLIADYTKQVRKEVKEEIAKNVSVVCINGVMYASYSDLEKILYDEKELPKWETLNKEGE